MDDMLDRLRDDPGRRTFGELVQERQWALGEIVRLRAELGRIRQRVADVGERAQGIPPIRAAENAINPMRFVRVKELKQLLGLSHSTIWKMTHDGRLPQPVRISQRATAWRMGDILAWQAGLGAGDGQRNPSFRSI